MNTTPQAAIADVTGIPVANQWITYTTGKSKALSDLHRLVPVLRKADAEGSDAKPGYQTLYEMELERCTQVYVETAEPAAMEGSEDAGPLALSLLNAELNMIDVILAHTRKPPSTALRCPSHALQVNVTNLVARDLGDESHAELV